MRKHRPAYTLLEISLVCALLVIVATVSFPVVRSAYASYKVQAATDTIRSGWADARTHAIEDGRSYRFSVVFGKGNFRIAPDDPRYWAGGPPPSEDNAPSFILENAIPNGISFATGGGSNPNPNGDTVLPPDSVQPSQYQTIAIFQSDGTSQDANGEDNLTITLNLPGAPSLEVCLNGMTGSSTVRKAGQ